MQQMVAESFIPIHIAGFGEREVFGDILWELICKALLTGQILMTVGGFVFRGAALACRKRARAIRREDGSFERVAPNQIIFALLDSDQPRLQPQPQPQQPLALPPPVDDLASAASSICLGLAIQGTPSPAKPNNFLPIMDAQAVVDNSELPRQEKIQLFENTVQKQQLDQDTAAAVWASTGFDKRPLPPINKNHATASSSNDHTTIRIIQALQEEVQYPKNLIQKYTSTNNNGEQGTPLQILISIPVPYGPTKLSTVKEPRGPIDPLQGPTDPYSPALGHENLQHKIHKWVVEVANIGKWPKPKIVAGIITDVIAVVQAEVTRIQNGQIGGKD